MKRGLVCIVAVLAFLGLSLVSAPRAAADHLFATDPVTIPDPDRINLVRACFVLGSTERTFPANKGFFVSHGWTTDEWRQQPALEKLAFMFATTTFRLWIDGELQHSALHSFNLRQAGDLHDVMFKLFVSEDHNGLSGTHVLVGQWFLDGSISDPVGNFGEAVLQFDCTLTVHFV